MKKTNNLGEIWSDLKFLSIVALIFGQVLSCIFTEGRVGAGWFMFCGVTYYFVSPRRCSNSLYVLFFPYCSQLVEGSAQLHCYIRSRRHSASPIQVNALMLLQLLTLLSTRLFSTSLSHCSPHLSAPNSGRTVAVRKKRMGIWRIECHGWVHL